MDKTQEEIVRGAEADRLINHPLINEFFTKAREGIVDSMESSPLGDDKTHNRLVIALQVLGQIEKSFKDVIATGKMASIQVQEASLVDKVKRFVRR
jgi:hypothetical protein